MLSDFSEEDELAGMQFARPDQASDQIPRGAALLVIPAGSGSRDRQGTRQIDRGQENGGCSSVPLGLPRLNEGPGTENGETDEGRREVVIHAVVPQGQHWSDQEREPEKGERGRPVLLPELTDEKRGDAKRQEKRANPDHPVRRINRQEAAAPRRQGPFPVALERRQHARVQVQGVDAANWFGSQAPVQNRVGGRRHEQP